MSAVSFIEANTVASRWREKGTTEWYEFEPNSYDKFGGTTKAVPRDPINKTGQRSKGTLVGLDAVAGLTQDFTQDNHQLLAQGFLRNDLSGKLEKTSTAVTATGYTVASGGASYVQNSLLFAKGFAAAANNGLKVVGAGSTATEVKVAGLTVAATGGTISRVGMQFAAGDVEVDVTGSYPALKSTVFDFTTLGLVPGETVFVGGDLAAEKFAVAVDNGYKRVKSVTANLITLDKSDATMLVDNGATKTIRLFFGRVLKNGTKRRVYEMERELGAPDDASTNVQAEYVTECTPEEMAIEVPAENKVTTKLNWLGGGSEFILAGSALKSAAGTIHQPLDLDAFNTASDVSRLNLSLVTIGDEAPAQLFAYVTKANVMIKTGAKLQKAVKVLGSIGAVAGKCIADADLEAYLTNLTALQSARDNLDITMDMTFARDNYGVSFDYPLGSLSEAIPDVKKDEAIMVPLKVQFARGRKYDVNMDHTIMVVFFDYLPNAAM